MSMPIQRQSEAFGYFDDGPRYARDRQSTDLPRGLAGLINTSGPRIHAGLLNTRQGAITDPDPSEQEGVGDMNWGGWKRRNLDENGELYQDWPNPNKSPDQRRDEAFQEWISKGAPHHGSRTASCEYCGEPGHDWQTHPEAHRDVADWEREKHGLEFPFGDYHEARLASDDFGPGPRDHGGAGPDGGPAVPDWYWDDDEGPDRSADEDEDYALSVDNDDPDRFLPGDHVANRRGSGRLPFDRLAETTLPGGSDRCDWCGEEGPTNRWQGASVPGRPSRSEDVCPDCVDAIPHKDEYQRFVDENHNGRHGRRAFNDFHNKTKMGNDDLWSWSNWMEGVQQRGHAAHDLEHAWESDLRNNRDGLDQLLRPHRWEASRLPFDRAAARRQAKDGGCTCWEGYERVPGTEPCASGSCRKKAGRRVALAPADPAAMAPQVPAGGGFLPAHRVGLPWRDQIIPGTVIGLDGPQVAVRWDDGQYSSEEPHNIQLL